MKNILAPGLMAVSLMLASAADAAVACSDTLSKGIPARLTQAPAGSAVMDKVLRLSGSERDTIVSEQVLSGNVPAFLRSLIPVTFSGKRADGRAVEVTICVTPDYLAVGDDRDFVRIPMGLPAAARIASSFGFLLPTPRMVDAIYAQAKVHLAPSPMKPTNQMSSTAYLVQHNRTVDGQRAPMKQQLGALTAGQKKDIVLSARLRKAPGRVAIYGWHRPNGKPIQPLSTVHGALYADYSHGVRLVSETAFVDGVALPLSEIMQDRQLSSIISHEGPISNPSGLLASLYR